MEQRKQIDNTIFTSAFAGVILFIASIAISLVTTTGGHNKEMPYIISSVASGISAIALLAYSVKKDKQRLAYNDEYTTDFQ